MAYYANGPVIHTGPIEPPTEVRYPIVGTLVIGGNTYVYFGYSEGTHEYDGQLAYLQAKLTYAYQLFADVIDIDGAIKKNGLS